MSDLEGRFNDLDRLEAPDQWDAIEARADGAIEALPARRWPPAGIFAFAVLSVLVLGLAAWLLQPEPEPQPAALGPPLVLAESQDAPDGAGSIVISIQDWSGVEGYRLLAGVWVADGWEEHLEAPLVGGAFWVIVDSDPFSIEDVVHPPLDPDSNLREGDLYSWGEYDYDWEETARINPGLYRIDLWANPDLLKPYGSHIPASPTERSCSIDVEVREGEVTRVVIAGIPYRQFGPCPTPEGSSRGQTVVVAVDGFSDRLGWDLGGVLYRGVGIDDPDARVVGGFAANVARSDFSTIQLVRRPIPEDDLAVFDGPFPYVSEEPLTVEPGTYTLLVWADDAIGPYSRWVPGASPGLVVCQVVFEVEEGQPETTVFVDGDSLSSADDLRVCRGY